MVKALSEAEKKRVAIYERFLQNMADGSKKFSAIKEVAEHFNRTPRTIYNIINRYSNTKENE